MSGFFQIHNQNSICNLLQALWLKKTFVRKSASMEPTAWAFSLFLFIYLIMKWAMYRLVWWRWLWKVWIKQLNLRLSLTVFPLYPEQPRHPQCTHSTIRPSSNLLFGTLQMQLVAKLVSLVCIHLKQHRFSYPVFFHLAMRFASAIFSSRQYWYNSRLIAFLL